jgi:hypothetical protein
VLACNLVAGAASAASPTIVSYKFTLAPGGAKTFPLPMQGRPVTLSASLTAQNGGTQAPTALILSTIVEDFTSKQLTWLSVNGDGSTVASNTLSGSTVAKFAFSNAVLTATATAGAGNLTITQSSTSTSIPFTYTVLMTY